MEKRFASTEREANRFSALQPLIYKGIAPHAAARSIHCRRSHFFRRNAVHRAVDAVAPESCQHRTSLIGTANQRIADGRSIQRGEEVAVYGGFADDPLLHIQLELDLPARKAADPVDGKFRVSSENPLPASELFPGDLPDAGVVLGVTVYAAVLPFIMCRTMVSLNVSASMGLGRCSEMLVTRSRTDLMLLEVIL